jgi:hypothetical protein
MALLPYCEEITFMGSDVSYNILHGVFITGGIYKFNFQLEVHFG